MPDDLALAAAARPIEDGLTCAEYAAMAARGAFDGLGRFELRGGRLRRMSPVHHPHARMTAKLTTILEAAIANANLDWVVATECSVEFGDGFTPTADIVVSAGEFDGFVPGAAARLIVEVALSSLADDLGHKAKDYARGGLAELLVADVQARVIHQLWVPEAHGYAQRAVIRFGEPLTLQSFPALALDTLKLR